MDIWAFLKHRQCNPAGGVHFAALLGSDNSYATPFEIPFLIRRSSWWRYMVGGPLLGISLVFLRVFSSSFTFF